MDIRNFSENISSPDELLRALGLERRRTRSHSFAAATGLIGAGILIGAGLVRLLVPRGGATPHGRVGSVETDGSRPLTQM